MIRIYIIAQYILHANDSQNKSLLKIKKNLKKHHSLNIYQNYAKILTRTRVG